MNDSIIVFLFILILLVDIFAIRDLIRYNISNMIKTVYIILILCIPIIGVSIYYATKSTNRYFKIK